MWKAESGILQEVAEVAEKGRELLDRINRMDWTKTAGSGGGRADVKRIRQEN